VIDGRVAYTAWTPDKGAIHVPSRTKQEAMGLHRATQNMWITSGFFPLIFSSHGWLQVLKPHTQGSLRYGYCL
jgi:hypothetical protein